MFEPLDIALRVALAVILMFAALKMLTKRHFSNLTYFDYVAAGTLGAITANLAFNVRIHILNFVLAIILLTLIIRVASYISIECRPIRTFLAGKPTVIIQDGRILEHQMAKLNYSYDYLSQQLRGEDIFDIARVKTAVLEPSGKLSVQVKRQYQPLTLEDLQCLNQKLGLATEVILDGIIKHVGLEQCSRNVDWLYEQLAKRGISVEVVAFAAIATNGNLYVELCRNNPIPSSKQ